MVGQVLDGAWALYARHFARVVAVAALVYLLLNLFTAFLGLFFSDSEGDVFMYSVLRTIIGLVGYFWVQGALVVAVADVREGKDDMSLRDLYARARPVLPALLLAGVLAALGIGVGLFLFVIPGLYMLTRWAVVTPVLVVERVGVLEAFGRSSRLVKGSAWSVFAIVVISIALTWVAWALIGGFVGAAIGGFVGAWVGNLIANALVTPFFAIAIAILYFRLRDLSPDTE